MTGLTVAIMAGGKSSRMGTDKSFVLVGGRPMIEVVLERVAGLGEETILIANRQAAYASLGLPTYSDILPERGPLGGIYTAIARSSQPHTLVVACDMPWLSRPLLRYMIGRRREAAVIVPRWDKFPEPLHAIYGHSCLEPIEARLRAGQLKITGFFADVAVEFVERATIVRFDASGRSFLNVNTPEQLAELEQQPPPP